MPLGSDSAWPVIHHGNGSRLLVLPPPSSLIRWVGSTRVSRHRPAACGPMEKVRSLSFWQYKLFGAMFGTFGVIALFLAAIGVYGVISYGGSQRTREIGVRVALAAQRHDVLTLVVRQGMTLAGIGIALGLLGAFGVTRVVASMRIGISPQDPLSFGAVSLFLALVALVDSVVLARRATRVDPIVSLRAE